METDTPTTINPTNLEVATSAQPMVAATESEARAESAAELNADEQKIWEALRTCYDPEIPVNIVDLGLVYDVALADRRADVKMTLTAPGCHMGGQIAGDVQAKLLALEYIEEANVELVWDPPWHPSMISAEGRRVLGME